MCLCFSESSANGKATFSPHPHYGPGPMGHDNFHKTCRSKSKITQGLRKALESMKTYENSGEKF